MQWPQAPDLQGPQKPQVQFESMGRNLINYKFVKGLGLVQRNKEHVYLCSQGTYSKIKLFLIKLPHINWHKEILEAGGIRLFLNIETLLSTFKIQ